MIDCQTHQTGLFIDYECPCSVIISSKGRVNKGASSTCGGSHANYSTHISVADIILTDLHHMALFHICSISATDMEMRPNSYLLQIRCRYFVTDILQIFHRTDMYICSISVSLVRDTAEVERPLHCFVNQKVW